MLNNFQQTVNLREKEEKLNKKRKNKIEHLEHVYKDKEDLQKINQPKKFEVNEKLAKRIIIILMIIFIGNIIYWLFLNGEEVNQPSDNLNWYAVKLINKEVYYGQVYDVSADPVIIKNVYYNYEQINNEGGDVNETDNIRLVKRGKETHGPSGIMDIIRSQIIYMEELKDDSKVLKAILEYEK